MNKQRVEKVREEMAKHGLDAFLVSNYYNILYLIWFKTLTTDEREAFVLVTQKNTYLFTDKRYINNQSRIQDLRSMIKIKLISPEKKLIQHLQEIIEEEKLHTLGFESEDLKFSEYGLFKSRLSNVEFSATDRLVIQVRTIKDKDEIGKIKKACQITDECLKDIPSFIRLGVSEKEIAFKIEYWLRQKNYYLAFDPIVAVDANTALPHYNTQDGSGKVGKNSLILIDFGVKDQDYLSDITRMFFFGQPNTEIINTYNHLLKIQQSAINNSKKVELLKDFDELCRQKLNEAGLPNYYHSTGHGVGLEIHEYPKVSFQSEETLQPNQVFTIEPGVYFEGKWGMRIEDTVYVNEKLKLISLTQFEKNLIILD